MGFLLSFLCLSAAQCQLVQLNSDFYGERVLAQIESGVLSRFQSEINFRSTWDSTNTVPQLPLAYEIDAQQLIKSVEEAGSWTWLIVSNNGCTVMPQNLPMWIPLFDSLKATGKFNFKYITTYLFQKQGSGFQNHFG